MIAHGVAGAMKDPFVTLSVLKDPFITKGTRQTVHVKPCQAPTLRPSGYAGISCAAPNVRR